MIPDITIPVERFHQVLVDEIQKQRPTYLQSSFTVAEIYQILVPYRSHRDALGVEMNGDYEDALLRLLAGAGDFVVLESEDARARILKELQSKNPNTGLFREFAGAGVHLNQESLPDSVVANAAAVSAAAEAVAVDIAELQPSEDMASEDMASEHIEPEHLEIVDDLGDSDPADATDELAALRDAAASVAAQASSDGGTYFDFETSSIEAIDAESDDPPHQIAAIEDVVEEVQEEHVGSATNGAAPAEEEPAAAVVAEPTPTEPVAGFWKPGEHPVSTTTAAEPAAPASMTDCLWCDESLPERSEINFCPFCGMSTTVKPCGSCRTEMEASWKFCISCGAQTSDEAS